MDNLDRTNVVQASLARWTLNRQLRELGILSAEGSIDDFEAVSKDFRESLCHLSHCDAGYSSSLPLQCGLIMQTPSPRHTEALARSSRISPGRTRGLVRVL